MRKKLGKEFAFLLGELIGKKMKVLKASSKGLQGLEGTILDESRNVILLETVRGRKSVPKVSCTFAFLPENVEVAGTMLLMKPEDRTKRLAKEFTG